jgi:hypothetical protein
MSSSKQAVVAALAVLVLLGGWVQGRISGRFGEKPVADTRLLNLPAFPKEAGEWQMVDDSTLEKSAEEMLEAKSAIVRTYRHRGNLTLIRIAMVSGPVGPIAVHTPDICFTSSSFLMIGDRTSVNIAAKPTSDGQPPGDAPGGTFWKSRFRGTDLDETGLFSYYAWSDGGPWQAAANPRVSFAVAPVLVKFQLSCETSSDAKIAESTAEDFLQTVLLPNWPPQAAAAP